MRAEHDHISLTDALAMTKASNGRTLLAMSRTDKDHTGILVVFLRHMGCAFCREAMADVARQRSAIESRGVRITLVHMAPDDAQAAAIFKKYALADLPRIADPDQNLYRAFELQRGSARQLFGPKCWIRGAAALLRGHAVGKLVGDGFQMPGVFLVRDGVIVRAFRHDSAADRPDYCALATA